MRVAIPFEGKTSFGVFAVPAGADHGAGARLDQRGTACVRGAIPSPAASPRSPSTPGRAEAEYDIPICGDYDPRKGGVRLDESATTGAKRMPSGGEPRRYYSPRAARYGEAHPRLHRALRAFEWDKIWDGLPELTRETFRVRSMRSRKSEAPGKGKGADDGRGGAADQVPDLRRHRRQDRLVPATHAEQLAAQRRGPGRADDRSRTGGTMP